MEQHVIKNIWKVYILFFVFAVAMALYTLNEFWITSIALVTPLLIILTSYWQKKQGPVFDVKLDFFNHPVFKIFVVIFIVINAIIIIKIFSQV